VRYTYSSENCAIYVQFRELCDIRTVQRIVRYTYSSENCAIYVQFRDLCDIRTV